jgi:ArsR family transcriptional regulator
MNQIFKALSEESRLRILSVLFTGELCVCDIEDILQLTQSNVSRHLTILKNAGIIKSYKNAQWIYYSIDDKFKSDSEELYRFLELRINKLSTYEADIERLHKCKEKDLCNLVKQ